MWGSCVQRKLNEGYGFVNFATTMAHNRRLKKGMVDSKKGRKLRFRKAVKKEASKQFLVGENSLSSQKASPTAENYLPAVNVYCLICCENLFFVEFFSGLKHSRQYIQQCFACSWFVWLCINLLKSFVDQNVSFHLLLSIIHSLIFKLFVGYINRNFEMVVFLHNPLIINSVILFLIHFIQFLSNSTFQ